MCTMKPSKLGSMHGFKVADLSIVLGVRGVKQIPWTASAYRCQHIYILFGDGTRLMAYYYYEMIPAYAVRNIMTHVKQLDLCHHSSFKTQQSVSKSN